MATYISSSNVIKAFPVVGRTYEGTSSSHLMTEDNITNILKVLYNKKSFVITAENNIIEFVLNGYYFKIEDENLLNTTPLYVYAKILEDASAEEHKYQYLQNIADATKTDLDNNSIFEGIAFSSSSSEFSGEYIYSLQILDEEGEIPAESKLHYTTNEILDGNNSENISKLFNTLEANIATGNITSANIGIGNITDATIGVTHTTIDNVTTGNINTANIGIENTGIANISIANITNGINFSTTSNTLIGNNTGTATLKGNPVNISGPVSSSTDYSLITGVKINTNDNNNTSKTSIGNNAGSLNLTGSKITINTPFNNNDKSFIITGNTNSIDITSSDKLSINNDLLISGTNGVTADKFVTNNGTSTQFVKGDGSLDSNKYVKTDSNNCALVTELQDPNNSLVGFKTPYFDVSNNSGATVTLNYILTNGQIGTVAIRNGTSKRFSGYLIDNSYQGMQIDTGATYYKTTMYHQTNSSTSTTYTVYVPIGYVHFYFPY